MKRKDNSPSKRLQKRMRRTRSVIFALLLVSFAAAVTVGNFLPTRSFKAFARQQGRSDGAQQNAPGSNGQGAEQMSEHARQQIAALMQEKATRTRGRQKMDSRLIYGIKMHRHEQIAE